MANHKVNGTLVWYYHICKRQVWLISRQLTPDPENPWIEIGRLIHQESFARERKEIDFENTKIDVMRNEDGLIIVGEIKKSSKYLPAAKAQLLFYLYKLRQAGLNLKGVLLIPKEKKRFPVELTDEKIAEIESVIKDIETIVDMPEPPKAVKCVFCTKCGYRDFCWS